MHELLIGSGELWVSIAVGELMCGGFGDACWDLWLRLMDGGGVEGSRLDSVISTSPPFVL